MARPPSLNLIVESHHAAPHVPEVPGDVPVPGLARAPEIAGRSDGSAARPAADAVLAAGGTIAAVVGVVDRQAGGRERFESAGYDFRALFTKADVLERHAALVADAAC